MTAAPPLFSLVTAVRGTELASLADTARSVRAQKLPDWEWILVTADCPDVDVQRLLDELTADARIRTVAAPDEAAGRGEFVTHVPPGVVLAARALKRMAAALNDEVDVAYSDQSVLTDEGRNAAYRKPDWAPERFRHDPYTAHLTVLRRSLVDEVGGLRPGPDAAVHFHDLLLRATERARRIVHVPVVLAHAGPDEPIGSDAWEAGVRAVQEHLDRVGIPATAERGRRPGRYRIVREPDLTTPVSVVIPTIGSGGLVWGRQRRMVVEAVRSVREHSRHRDLEFVVVYDTLTPPEVLADLRTLPGVRLNLVEFTEPFNFSAKCNVGALHATGDVIVFLNDDVEAESHGLIERLIAPLREDGVGATGAKLLFPSMRIQHAGVSYGDGAISHSYYRRGHPGEDGVRDDLWTTRETTALTGACLAMRRAVFAEVGGFTEQLPMNFNDIDLCLKIDRTGRRLLWLHDVVLFHFESISRSPDVAEWESRFMRQRWGNYHAVRERHTGSIV